MKVQMANYSLACRTCYRVVSATELHRCTYRLPLAGRVQMWWNVGDEKLALDFDQRSPA